MKTIKELETEILILCSKIIETYYEGDERKRAYGKVQVVNWSRKDTILHFIRSIQQHNFSLTTIEMNKRRISKLFTTSLIREEDDDLITLNKLYTELVKERNQNNNIIKKLNEFKFILNEVKRFNSFKNNQDLFDNTISILKIIQDFEYSQRTKTSFRPDFDNKKEIDLGNQLYDFGLSRIINLRYFANLSQLI